MLQSKAPVMQNPSDSETSIGPGVHLQGNLRGKTHVRLHGTLDGDIIVDGQVTVGEGGRVNGHIHAHRVLVDGDVYGNLEVRDKVHLGSTARIKGDIRTASISIQEGAWFEGSVTERPANDRPEASREPMAEYRETALYR